ncbi:hypothetical protein N7494_005332 [Penicillium frequentans]|uniref:Helicase C-terminal domain-containing protein n=1 Tax=Penicillium frequentans TaxID=3151616 RepID=A0AAD6GFB7_9EURO|nr:hypothetical protein N7494_005332 [Penicillium glabrum]
MDTVKVYHSRQGSNIKELQKPGSQSKLRVLMTTEALALGVDLQDIDQVVIYRFPKTYNQQRSGNAVVGLVALDKMGR